MLCKKKGKSKNALSVYFLANCFLDLYLSCHAFCFLCTHHIVSNKVMKCVFNAVQLCNLCHIDFSHQTILFLYRLRAINIIFLWVFAFLYATITYFEVQIFFFVINRHSSLLLSDPSSLK